MYCGDETGAFVGDCGSSSCRFGYGGEDAPKLVIPGQIASDGSKTSIGYPAISYPRKGLELIPIYETPKTSSSPALEQYLKSQCYSDDSSSSMMDVDTSQNANDGAISNWDAWESTWEHAFTNLRVRDPNKNSASQSSSSTSTIVHPVLVVESGHAPKAQREQIAELMFETFNVPSMFIMPSPVLAAFSAGRQTALVIDCGGGGCRVSPIVDGIMLKRAQRRNNRGGDWLSDQLFELFAKKDINAIPRYVARHEKLKSSSSAVAALPDVTRSFFLHSLREVLYEFKTAHCGIYPAKIGPYDSEEVREAVRTHMSHAGHEHLRKFELPDGTIVNVGEDHPDLFLLPELLFDDEDKSVGGQGLHKMAHEALSASDIDSRKELCANMILCGAGSQFKGLENRLAKDMTTLCPSSYRCRVIASKHSVERMFAPWIGGSILTSLGSFQQLWLSKAEYEENGVTLAAQKFH
mmetsp:Transcript_19913/g.29625  ORF Transcript_19913/g.29625 Transcript_19913/m.29625 type:complete len:465 (-) Transcript_19913:74-1468(-)|eukprot:CAMPEP_0116004370 /NCGR_PEP_ID=MMETSP0321-20121206/564_1 /TAXON_ID=163516 /ORGANISM="Leptocylindrus danicus var. danicus, Strain B650" /LENGTH=464 /DNA_ID=CAMNT_0003472663 /DNA_START=17 /DNA_END=1411 /DNA_ORIENTATION=-